MALDKPYHRIWRPFIDAKSRSPENYLRDPRYADNAGNLIRGFQLIEKELARVFEFIEPCDSHQDCHSHQLYALFLRACTEFESNAKGILLANGYPDNGRLNIFDYQKLNAATRLSEYEVTVHGWSGVSRDVRPFMNWSTQPRLPWYSAYNTVKHNRSGEFPAASLGNVVTAVAGVFVTLFSQFHVCAFHSVHTGMYQSDDDDGTLSYQSSMFGIRTPQTWTADEHYDFYWDSLKGLPTPLAKYAF